MTAPSCRCISVLKNLLFGDAAPLGFLTQAITIMSGGMIPCMMLLLGSGLSKGPGESSLPAKVVVTTVIVRLLVLPALGRSRADPRTVRTLDSQLDDPHIF